MSLAFQAAVLARFPEIKDPLDAKLIRRTIDELEAKGFSIADAVRYCLTIEQINPDIDEATACKTAAMLMAKYKG